MLTSGSIKVRTPKQRKRKLRWSSEEWNPSDEVSSDSNHIEISCIHMEAVSVLSTVSYSRALLWRIACRVNLSLLFLPTISRILTHLVCIRSTLRRKPIHASLHHHPCVLTLVFQLLRFPSLRFILVLTALAVSCSASSSARGCLSPRARASSPTLACTCVHCYLVSKGLKRAPRGEELEGWMRGIFNVPAKPSMAVPACKSGRW